MSFQPTIGPENLFSWASQVCQYPYKGEPGIEYFPGETPEGIVDCLLYRNDKGHIVGILNHFPWSGRWEKKGNVNIWIHRKWQRQGIGRALWDEAVRRFGCKLEGQRFTPAGAAFARALAREAAGMAKWQASILYGPEVEWGTPEDLFENLLRERGIEEIGVDAGTELMTGQRDFTCYFEATSDQMAELQKAAPGWRISEYRDDDDE